MIDLMGCNICGDYSDRWTHICERDSLDDIIMAVLYHSSLLGAPPRWMSTWPWPTRISVTAQRCCKNHRAWWRHQIETFSTSLLALCEGNPPVTGGFHSQKPVTRNVDVFFDLHKRLSKQSRHRWFVTPSRSLWRHCNAPLKLNCRYFDDLFVIGCIGNCHFDNLPAVQLVSKRFWKLHFRFRFAKYCEPNASLSTRKTTIGWRKFGQR